MRNTRNAFVGAGDAARRAVREKSGPVSRENKHFARPWRAHLEIPPSNRCADNDLPDIGGSLLSCLPAAQTPAGALRATTCALLLWDYCWGCDSGTNRRPSDGVADSPVSWRCGTKIEPP